MKMDVEKLLSVEAAGPARITCGIMKDEPPTVAVVAMGGGQVVKLMLSTDEARAFGEMLLVSGAIAQGGMPPVLEPAPVSPSVLKFNGERH